MRRVSVTTEREAAESSLVAVSRRVLRDLGDPVEAFRLSSDLVAFLLPDCTQVDAAEMALSASRAANNHLVSGRRVDSIVGYALAPRDGHDAGGTDQGGSGIQLRRQTSAER